MTKPLPPAKIIGHADPDVLSRINARKEEKATEVIRTLISVFDDIPPEEERVYGEVWDVSLPSVAEKQVWRNPDEKSRWKSCLGKWGSQEINRHCSGRGAQNA